MSILTNPASGSRENAAAYIRAVTALVADHDPIEVMRATAAPVAAAVAGLTPDELAAPESTGKWSIGEVIQHLADSELIFGYRIRRVLAENGPVLEGYDQDLWAERLRYSEADPAESLQVFRTLRAANLRLLSSASESDLSRVGRHAERGQEALRDMLRLYAGHDIVHLRQIDRIRDSWAQSQGG